MQGPWRSDSRGRVSLSALEGIVAAGCDGPDVNPLYEWGICRGASTRRASAFKRSQPLARRALRIGCGPSKEEDLWRCSPSGRRLPACSGTGAAGGCATDRLHPLEWTERAIGAARGRGGLIRSSARKRVGRRTGGHTTAARPARATPAGAADTCGGVRRRLRRAQDGRGADGDAGGEHAAGRGTDTRRSTDGCAASAGRRNGRRDTAPGAADGDDAAHGNSNSSADQHGRTDGHACAKRCRGHEHLIGRAPGGRRGAARPAAVERHG